MTELDAQLSSAGHSPDSVLDDVPDHLPKLIGIGQTAKRFGRGLDLNTVTSVKLGTILKEIDRFLDKGK